MSFLAGLGGRGAVTRLLPFIGPVLDTVGNIGAALIGSKSEESAGERSDRRAEAERIAMQREAMEERNARARERQETYDAARREASEREDRQQAQYERERAAAREERSAQEGSVSAREQARLDKEDRERQDTLLREEKRQGYEEKQRLADIQERRAIDKERREAEQEARAYERVRTKQEREDRADEFKQQLVEDEAKAELARKLKQKQIADDAAFVQSEKKASSVQDSLERTYESLPSYAQGPFSARYLPPRATYSPAPIPLLPVSRIKRAVAERGERVGGRRAVLAEVSKRRGQKGRLAALQTTHGSTKQPSGGRLTRRR